MNGAQQSERSTQQSEHCIAVSAVGSPWMATYIQILRDDQDGVFYCPFLGCGWSKLERQAQNKKGWKAGEPVRSHVWRERAAGRGHENPCGLTKFGRGNNLKTRERPHQAAYEPTQKAVAATPNTAQEPGQGDVMSSVVVQSHLHNVMTTDDFMCFCTSAKNEQILFDEKIVTKTFHLVSLEHHPDRPGHPQTSWFPAFTSRVDALLNPEDSEIGWLNYLAEIDKERACACDYMQRL